MARACACSGSGGPSGAPPGIGVIVRTSIPCDSKNCHNGSGLSREPLSAGIIVLPGPASRALGHRLLNRRTAERLQAPLLLDLGLALTRLSCLVFVIVWHRRPRQNPARRRRCPARQWRPRSVAAPRA